MDGRLPVSRNHRRNVCHSYSGSFASLAGRLLKYSLVLIGT